MNHSARRINKLGGDRYLEIGVHYGRTFLDVQIPHKVGVDPSFRFDTRRHRGEFHAMPSDRYFAEISGDAVFDVIFIDGLHTFEQTLRDFINTLAHSHADTVWVIDDTVPCDVHSTLRTQAQAVAARKAAGGHGAAWHGDVYKLVFMLHDFFPAYRYATAMEDNPQTIVRRQPRPVAPLFDDMSRIANLTYEDTLTHRDILNPMSEDKAIDCRHHTDR